jgi:hypothetical protein
MDNKNSDAKKDMNRSNRDKRANSAGDAKNSANSKIWKTKFGPRRVRHDPPTLEEAIIAASGLTDDVSEQVEIAASLMGAPAEEVKAAMKVSAASQKHSSAVVLAHGTRGTRTVVVERKPSRRIVTDRPVSR